MALQSDLLQAYFSPGLLIGSLLFSFLLGSLSGIFPAVRAAKLHPVQALSKGK
jgi:ABC-type antimicrobial peptide transport system permease subunit